MPDSSAVTAGTNATAEQYNDLRTDAITRYRVLYFNIEGSISAATGLQVIPLPFNCTITKIVHKCKSGSGTLTVKTVAGTTIKSGMSVTTSYTEETSGLAGTSRSANDELQIDLTSASSLVDIRVMVHVTEIVGT